MAEISRRGLLQGAGLLGATATLPASAQQRPAPAAYAFFTPAEAAFIEAAVDRLIPPDPKWAGAVEAGVPVYIDGQLAGDYGRGQTLYLEGPWKRGTPEQGYQLRFTPAELYRRSLAAIGGLGPEGSGFAGLPAAEQDAFLKRLEAGAFDLGGYSSAIFFETLLANTVEGFFADPAYGGNRDKVGWRMVGFPGAYAAFLTLYTHHGMRFDREPLGMAEHSGHAHPISPLDRT